MRANSFVQLRLLLALCLVSNLALPAVAHREPAEDPAAAQADPKGESKPDDVPAKKSEPPSGSGGTPSTGAETATTPVDPKLVRVSLVDGSLIAGKFSIEEIVVETEFGTLTIPITKIVRFTPGLDSHPELREQVQQLVQDLGGEDDRNRETAQLALVKMGLPVRSQLREHRESANAELSRRVKAILADLDRLAEDLEEVQPGGPTEWIREDTVVTADFTVVGRVSPQQFTVQNRFGTLNIPIGDIKVVSRKVKSGLEDVRKSLSLDGTYLAQQKYKSSGVQVQKGDRVTVTATGKISRSGSTSYTSTPAGSSRLGTFSQNPTVYGGTLVARIGGSGKVIKVGSKSTFTCTRGGVLRFAIGMRPDYVGRYQFPGQYNLKVFVKRAE